MEKKAIIIGCGTGIGRALAVKLSKEGYVVGLTGRDPEKLKAIQAELPGESFFCKLDVRNTGEAVNALNGLITKMQGTDLLVINAGVLFPNEKLEWSYEEETAMVNVMGFMAMANAGVRYFLKNGSGTLAGISSVAGHRGSGRSPAYNASKAFMMNYLEGLRQKVSSTSIKVIDIRPGFVDTEMIKGRKGLFGVASPEKAAADIYNAIRKEKRIAYIPGWWAIVMWFFKRLPESIYHYGYRKYIAWDNTPSSRASRPK